MTTLTADPQTRELRVADRCDNRDCNAQARVRAIFEDGAILDFCAHDFAEIEGPLTEQSSFIIDERDQIS